MNRSNIRIFFTENPMLVEARRFGRKFFGMSRGGTSNYIFLGLALLIYLLLLGISVAFRTAFSSEGMIHFQTGLFCFIVPALTYGAVAGEREKRTWELLVVAPISKAQIIVGKYLSAVMVIASVALLMLPLIALSFDKEHEHLGGALLSECISLWFALGVAAMCIFISARTNRTLTSQAMIYSALFGWLALFPMLVATAYAFRPGIEYWLWIHPIYAIGLASGETHWITHLQSDYSQFGARTVAQSDPNLYFFSAPIQFAFYSIMIGLFICAAIASIKSEGARESRRGKNAAR